MTNFTKDTVIPRTGIFLHTTELNSNRVKVENITYDYQSIAEYSSILLENIYQVFVLLDGDNGIGAFHLPLCTVERKRKKRLSKFHSELKQNCESYHCVIENHLKCNGKSKQAYHEDQWNGKDTMTQRMTQNIM